MAVTYSITYNNIDGATFITDKYSYDETMLPFTLDQPSRLWYDWLWWAGWNGRIPEQVVTIPVWTTWNLVFYAVWRAQTWIEYRVEHWLQNPQQTWYFLADTDIEYWTTDTYTHAEANDYPWYVLREPVHQQLIKWDGSTVITIYYNLENPHPVSWWIIINGNPLRKRIIDGQEVQKVICNGTQIWELI